MTEIRAHHGMCLYFFEGKGYNEEFTRHMTALRATLTEDNPFVRITTDTDHICSRCPNQENGTCISSSKVSRYDRKVLEFCAIPSGSEMPFSEFEDLVIRKILLPGHRPEICGDCEWDSLCARNYSRPSQQ